MSAAHYTQDTKSHLDAIDDDDCQRRYKKAAVLAFHHNKELILKSHQLLSVSVYVLLRMADHKDHSSVCTLTLLTLPPKD